MRNYHLRGEEGAIAATATVMMVALLGIAMLAIDGGQLFTSRRNVLTDTDAAALAAAREMVGNACNHPTAKDDATLVVEEILTANDVTTTHPDPVIFCDAVLPDGMAGRVKVSATRKTDLAFGGLAGIPDVDVRATSVAQYGTLATGTGVRPIALCNKDPHFLEWARDIGSIDDEGIRDLLDDPSTEPNEGQPLLDLVNTVAGDPAAHLTHYPAADGSNAGEPGGPHQGDVHRVDFSRQGNGAGCGGADGNWGWLDLDGNGGNADLQDWLQKGYPHPISVGDDEDCAPLVDETNCIGQPGAGGGSWDTSFEAIQCDFSMTASECAVHDKAFPIIVFTAQCTGGNGGPPGASEQEVSKAPKPPKGPNPPKGPPEPDPTEEPTELDDTSSDGEGDPNCDGGDGARARYDHVAFLAVIVRDWKKVTGQTGDGASWFGLEFVEEYITSGTISGTPSAIGPGLMGVQLCGGSYAGTVDNYCVVPVP